MSFQPLRHPPYPSGQNPSALWRQKGDLDAAAYAPPQARTPMTSAVLAGWICVGIGLLTAWLFPLAHFFFSIGIILSIVAMATHQVRRGLQLLAGSLAGIFVCAVLFIFWVSVAVAGVFHAAAKEARLEARPNPWTLATPGINTAFPVDTPYAPRAVSVVSNPAPNTDARPLALDEVTIMLGEGRRDDEIIAMTTGRQLSDQIGTPEITTLRVYGASERLINNLRTRPLIGSLPRPAPHVAQRSTAPARLTVTAPAMPVVQTPVAARSTPPPIDDAARDRQIRSLQKSIDSLDEQVRQYRTASHSTFNQQTGDDYLKYLDRQRDDLRRQKWALEGR